jgi:hypothetical protein
MSMRCVVVASWGGVDNPAPELKPAYLSPEGQGVYPADDARVGSATTPARVAPLAIPHRGAQTVGCHPISDATFADRAWSRSA